MKDYYEILGVNKNADAKQIKSAYLNMLKKYHPDIYEGDKAIAQQKTQEINLAYDTLSDTSKKQAYDNSLKNIFSLPKTKVQTKQNSNEIAWYKRVFVEIKKLKQQKKEKKKLKQNNKNNNIYNKTQNNAKNLDNKENTVEKKEIKKLNILIFITIIIIILFLLPIIVF